MEHLYRQDPNPATLSKDISDLTRALSPVKTQLLILSEKIADFIPAQTSVARTVVNHVFSQPGKLVRPGFYFMVCDLVGYCGDQLYPMAAVCEYVHTASLLHDDVVDNSTLRRNKPTANSIWGDQGAVLVGDLIYSTASEMMAKTGELSIVISFSHAIQRMSEAELLQLEHVFNLDLTEKIYETILQGKTGALIGSACYTAGVLGRATPDQCEALRAFGASIGIAFQLLDDALDYMGDRLSFGKKTLSDLLEGRVTLPIILLRSLLAPEEFARVRTICRKEQVTGEGLKEIARLVSLHETAEKTIVRAGEHTRRAIAILRQNFPFSPARERLEFMAQSLLSRVS